MPLFEEYVGIDYSGAATDEDRLRGIQVYRAGRHGTPSKVHENSDEPTWKWSRKTLTNWLVEYLQRARPVIVALDHAFSFPESYMKRNRVGTWNRFLVHFHSKWKGTRHTRVQELLHRTGPLGEAHELRLTDKWTASAKSVFYLGRGMVAYSTYTGIPQLRLIRQRLGKKVHFWPFDGFDPPEGKPVVAEVYPALFKNRYDVPKELNERKREHERDAFVVAKWLQDRDAHGLLEGYFSPPLTPKERKVARLEGWILGVS